MWTNIQIAILKSFWEPHSQTFLKPSIQAQMIVSTLNSLIVKNENKKWKHDES